MEGYIDSIIMNRFAKLKESYSYDPISLTKWKVKYVESRKIFNEEDFHGINSAHNDRIDIILVFTQNNNFQDFSLAWNLQAVRPFYNLRVTPFPLLIPIELLKDCSLATIIEKINKSLFSNRIPINHNIFAISESLNKKFLQQLTKDNKITIFDKNRNSIFKDNSLTIGDSSTTVGICDDCFINIDTPKIPYQILKGNYSIDIAAEGVIVPKRQKVRSYYPFGSYNSHSSKFGITFNRSIEDASTVLSIPLPKPYEVLEGYVASRDMSIDLSESGKLGRIAQLLLQEKRLHRLKIISNKNIYILLDNLRDVKGRGLYEKRWNKVIRKMIGKLESDLLTLEDKEKLELLLCDFKKETVKIIESESIKDRKGISFGLIKKELGLKNIKQINLILKWLLNKHILERRAKIICQVCGEKIYLETNDLNETIMCPICFNNFRFVNPENELNWEYYMTESWGRIQNGDILPALFTLLYLEFKHGERTYIEAFQGGWTGVEFKTKREKEFGCNSIEVDIVAFVYRELVLGESKIKSKEFITEKGERQINNLVKLAKIIEVNFLIFSSLDKMSKEIIEKVSDIVDKAKFKGKTIFLDENDLLNQDIFAGNDKNTETHLKNMVEFLRYWEKEKEKDIY